MITVIAKLQANPGKEQELQVVLTKMVGEVKEKESGVSAYSLHVSAADPTLFVFYEQYSNAAAFDAHGKTDHMKAMGASIAGLLAGRPVIERYTQIAGANRVVTS